MTEASERIGVLLICGAYLVAAVLISGGNPMYGLLFYGVPMAIFVTLASLCKEMKSGWLMSVTTAFFAVAIFENYWEGYIYKGPNSMPGFVYLFMCIPLCVIGLWPAWLTAKVVHRVPIVVRTTLSFMTIFLIGSAVVLLNIVKTN